MPAIIVMVQITIGAGVVIIFAGFLVEEIIRRIPMMAVGFLCKVSVVVIFEEVFIMVIWVIVVVLVEHVIMTVGFITVGIRSVGVKTAILGVA